MALIADTVFERTLDRLTADYAGGVWRGAQLEAWLFEGAPARRAAEKTLAAAGVTARLYSAYKPLVHFFLEEDAARGPFKHIAITYPVDGAADDRRFLLEAYPLAALVGEAALRFIAAQPGGAHAYELVLTAADGRVAQHTVDAPNRCGQDPLGDTQLSPCGWLRVSHPDGRQIDARLDTDYAQLFHEALRLVDAHPWGATEPYFEALHLTASLPGGDTRLPVGEEAISLHEALHEELYFSLLELFQKKSGRPGGARDLKPGQIIPEIVAFEGPISLRIETRPLTSEDAAWPAQPLHEASGPFSAAAIEAALAALGGELFEVTSRAGRRVPACYVHGSDHPLMLSGGQHANETSGVAGALRAASLLAERPGAHFAVSPLENPDGYALHWHLCRRHPRHLHHAARYTALGDDLEYREAEPLDEKGIRLASYARTQARLHVNLHGYPSHEWTRPLTGYIPRHFADWTLPKGFFLMVRHHEGWAERARRLLEHITQALAQVPGLVPFNAAQRRLYEVHAGPLALEVLHGFPCLISRDARHLAPLTLISEFPDQTIAGDAFKLAHEAQTRTVLAAYDALQVMMEESHV